MKKKLLRIIEEMGCVFESTTDGFSIESKHGNVFVCTGVHKLCYHKADLQSIGDLYALAIEDIGDGLEKCIDEDCEWCEE